MVVSLFFKGWNFGVRPATGEAGGSPSSLRNWTDALGLGNGGIDGIDIASGSVVALLEVTIVVVE